jgi:hypothetical protein
LCLQVQIAPIIEKVNGDDNAAIAINRLLHRLESIYLDLNDPKPDPLPSFERSVHSDRAANEIHMNLRDKVSLNIVLPGAEVRHLSMAGLSSINMASFHSVLMENGYLCDKDIEEKSLSLCVDIIEIITVRSFTVR